MIDGFKGILLCRCLLVPYSQVRLLISPFSRLRGASSKFRLFDLELQFQAKASQLQFQVKAGQFQAKAIWLRTAVSSQGEPVSSRCYLTWNCNFKSRRASSKSRLFILELPFQVKASQRQVTAIWPGTAVPSQGELYMISHLCFGFPNGISVLQPWIRGRFSLGLQFQVKASQSQAKAV